MSLHRTIKDIATNIEARDEPGESLVTDDEIKRLLDELGTEARRRLIYPEEIV